MIKKIYHRANNIKNRKTPCDKLCGFTLIELMVACVIFSIIMIVSYRLISNLLIAKSVVSKNQNKCNLIAKLIEKIDADWENTMPITVQDEYGVFLPVVIINQKLDSDNDNNFEFTISGKLGNSFYPTHPPQRIGYRFVDGKLYLVVYHVLHRVHSKQYDLYLISDQVKDFFLELLDKDNQWQRNDWPLEYKKKQNDIVASITGQAKSSLADGQGGYMYESNATNLYVAPKAIRINIELLSGEIFQKILKY